MRISSLTILAVEGLLILGSCGRQHNDGGPKAVGISCAPVRIALLLDQTDSTNWTRTPQLRPDDLDPLIEVIKRCGGELGLGLIRDQSNRPLVRLRLERPPEAPMAVNPLRALKARPAYEQSRAQWLAESAEQIRRFQGAARVLLERPSHARCTDVWGAVLRADLFLAEEDPVWGPELSRWAVFVTDGQHNCGTAPVAMPSGARLAVVNGSASLGALSRLNPLRFESPEAAFRFVEASASRGKDSLKAVRFSQQETSDARSHH